MTTKRKERPKESLAERVYRELRSALILGDIQPGSTFNEADLIEQFKVSTSPLREALTRLHQDGLIKAIPRKGYLVTELTLGDFHDLIQLRLVLEAAAAELAATRITDAHLHELTRLSNVVIVAGDRESYRDFMRANQAFHELIANVSGNRRLARALRQNFEEVQRILFFYADFKDSSGEETNPNDHAGIIDALARRDPDLARQAVISHIKLSRSRVIDRLIRDTDRLSGKAID